MTFPSVWIAQMSIERLVVRIFSGTLILEQLLNTCNSKQRLNLRKKIQDRFGSHRRVGIERDQN